MTLEEHVARLGEQVAADGVRAHAHALSVLAALGATAAPAAAQALADAGAPDVVRERALAVVSAAVCRAADADRSGAVRLGADAA